MAVQITLSKVQLCRDRWDTLETKQRGNVTRDWEAEEIVWPDDQEDEDPTDQDCQDNGLQEDSSLRNRDVFTMRKLTKDEMRVLGIIQASETSSQDNISAPHQNPQPVLDHRVEEGELDDKFPKAPPGDDEGVKNSHN